MSPARHTGVDWGFVGRGFTRSLVPLTFALISWIDLTIFIQHPYLWSEDSNLYWAATADWLHGGDPWAVSVGGVAFAGWPPTLLLDVPLIPFGPAVATVFWHVAGVLGALAIIRASRLPLWWLAFPPLVEGWLPGSPDAALAGLVVLSAGSIAALTKPYAVPAMVGDGRFRSVALAVVLGLGSLLVLPWQQFLAALPSATANLEAQSHYGSLAIPLVLVGVAALVSLGWRMGLGLTTPLLWPFAQLHYTTFSTRAASVSPLLAISLAIPVRQVALSGVLLYAIDRWRRRRRDRQPAATSRRRTERAPSS